ncbi:MAG TPA: biosynthetic peptidoglycan transglycosylase [Gemmatimonadales bacterium]|nr:biosynthetic peptidoglycan transglycosylase [Gemmatimonadales bacterium]
MLRTALRWTAIAGGVFLLWLMAVWPPPLWYRTHWPAQTAFMSMRGNALDGAAAGPRGRGAVKARGRGFPDEPTYRPVPLDSISIWLPRAAMIGEDNRFLEHHGIDYLAILEALGYRRAAFAWSDPRDRAELRYTLGSLWSRRAKLRGASTITQQLAKNLYLSPDRNPLRKVKEGVTAYRLEAALSKRRLMELYLNVAEFGPNIWGAEAASQFYFDRPASRMTPAQAASLAGSLPFPLSSNPAYRTGRMRWRRDLILRRMRGEAVEIPQEADDETVPPPPVMEEIVVPDSI